MSLRECAGLAVLINSRFNSMSAARSTCGAPIVIPAQTTGSVIQLAIDMTMPVGPCTLRNWPVARCSTRRTKTLRRK